VEFLGFIDLDDGKKELPPATTEMPAGHRVQPVFSTRKISTHVTAAGGQTIVLGGMARETTVMTEDKVRGLGDAPLVGPLFRSRTESKVKRHLFVFVTPRIVKPVIAGKSVTITSDSQTYDKATGVVTASGNVRIETPQAVIKADKAEIKPKPGAAGTPAGAAQRAAKIVIPRMEFQDATINDALDFLREQAVKQAEGNGGVRTVQMAEKETLAQTTNYLRRVREQYKEQAVNIVLLPDAKRDAKVTLNLRNVPLSEALRYLAQLTGNELAWTAEAAVIGKAGSLAAKPRHDDAPSTDAARKAAKIVIPSIELVEAPLSSVIEFLVKKSRELDSEKKGVNVILQLSGDKKPPAITLNLRNVPLLQALKYVAAIANLELVADEHALRLQQKAGNKQP
jgi:Flp pilus assembly secretin CpaC